MTSDKLASATPIERAATLDRSMPPYACPKCRHTVDRHDSSYECHRCHTEYPILFGIPDFRPDVSAATRELEIAQVEQILAKRKSSPSFADLMAKHIEIHTEPDLVARELDYELKWCDRGHGVKRRLDHLLQRSKIPVPAHGSYLDVGCGKGAAAICLARQFAHTYAVDSTLRYLIFAQALIQETDQSNITLVCASAHCLPFRDCSFDLVTALDVIEHLLPDQLLALQEIVRVVDSPGVLYLNSPNRFSLFTPEDHVGLWWLGFLPRKWMGAYVRFRLGYEYVGTRLLSLKELKTILFRCTAASYIDGAIVTDANRAVKRFLQRNPPVVKLCNAVFRKFIPIYNVLVQK